MNYNRAQTRISGILCATLGVSAKNSYVMNSVAIPRIPGESIGGICRLVDGKGTSLTLNVEYNQLDPLLKETPSGGKISAKSTVHVFISFGGQSATNQESYTFGCETPAMIG